jgi:hypothetical protein
MFEARDVEDYLLAFEEDRLLNIVACSNAKVWNDRLADEKTYPARVAYRGGMFKQAMQCFLDLKSRRGREPRWLVLSAKYGLLEPDDEIADYNVSFSVKSDGDKVIRQEDIEKQWNEKQLDRYDLVFVWGGETYADRVSQTLKNTGLSGTKLISPAAGLSIGRAMGVLKDFREALVGKQLDNRSEVVKVIDSERRSIAKRASSIAGTGGSRVGKYEPLKRYLESSGNDFIDLSFSEIERILGFRLPDSACRYRAWWSNEGGTHAHSLSWLEAGYKTIKINMLSKTIRFTR